MAEQRVVERCLDRVAPLDDVLKFVAAINGAGMGARPQSSEFILGCQRAKDMGLLRQEGRDRWLTPKGTEALGRLSLAAGSEI